MTANQSNVSLNDENRTEISKTIKTLQDKLPFLKTLTAEERCKIPMIGEKGRIFVRKCHELAEQNKEIFPRAFDLQEYSRGVKLAEDLKWIQTQLEELTQLVRDTYVEVESDSYTSSFLVYQLAKHAGKASELDEYQENTWRRPAHESRAPEPVGELV